MKNKIIKIDSPNWFEGNDNDSRVIVSLSVFTDTRSSIYKVYKKIKNRRITRGAQKY